MKNIIVISIQRSLGTGGAEVVWENLKKQGMKFINISPNSDDLPIYYKKITDKFHLREIFSSRWLLKKALSKNPEVIIYDKIFGWKNIKSNVKKICYNHGSYTLAGLTFKKKNKFIYLFYKYIMNYFEKKSYKNADKIIAVSESVKNEMINYFKITKEKIIVINNGINLKEFKQIKNKKELKKKYGLPFNKKIIFFPGRPSFGKGFDVAEKVLEKLGNDYFMFVLGSGNSKLKNIKFIGKISNEKMPEIYNCADLCLFPSRYEGNSISVFESAACGIPLVLSRVGEMKTNKKMNKFICDSVDEYVKKIKNLNIIIASKEWKTFSMNFSLDRQILELESFLVNEK